MHCMTKYMRTLGKILFYFRPYRQGFLAWNKLNGLHRALTELDFTNVMCPGPHRRNAGSTHKTRCLISIRLHVCTVLPACWWVGRFFKLLLFGLLCKCIQLKPINVFFAIRNGFYLFIYLFEHRAEKCDLITSGHSRHTEMHSNPDALLIGSPKSHINTRYEWDLMLLWLQFNFIIT